MERILEVALDNGVQHTRYYALNKEVSIGCNDRFFEGTTIGSVKIQPLKEAKIWAKKNGFTHLQTVRITRGVDKLYIL